MARYELRERGVFDRLLGRAILPRDAEWADYEASLARHEAPDLEAPPEPRPIEERRREVSARVNWARTRALETLTVEAAGVTFAADTASYANLVGVGLLLVAGEPLPAGFTWRTVDNQLVPLTAAQVRALVKLMVQAREAVYRRSWELKDTTIPASDNPESLDLDYGVTGIAPPDPPKLPPVL